MLEIVSYILLGIFLITHGYWQVSLYYQSKRINTKYFRNTNDTIQKLKQESNLPKEYFQKLNFIKKISKYSLGLYLICFILMIINNLSD